MRIVTRVIEAEETLLDVAEAVRAVRQVAEAGTVETPAVVS